MSRLQDHYTSKVAKELQNQFGYKNTELVPRIEKIVLNVGAGEIQTNKQYLDSIVSDLSKIAGQKGVVTKAKKAISSFKVREGNPVGIMVTLRGKRMYEFLDKLISITIPRLRDFRGFSLRAFDGHGNYSLGIKEQTVFTEIPYESINHLHGIQVVIHTSARTDEEGTALLAALGFPFAKQTH